MNNEINSYDYRPRFSFFKTGNEKSEDKKLVVGFELEAENIADNITKRELAEGISEIINNDEQFLYYKRDGSLDNGIEVVSMPFSLDWIRENKSKIEEVLQYMRESGFQSHDPGTCGLHFHINKEYFGNTPEELENNIDKLIVFTEYYKEKLIKFSRRNCFDYCHFLGDKRYLNDEDRLNILKIKKEKYNVDRYMVVNIENSKTVEFRLIRGTLNFHTFMASVEFIFSLAKVIKNNKITDISWNDVINFEGNEFIQQYCMDRDIPSDANKMKDYSIDFLKKQNKIKADIEKTKREIIIKVYDMILKITKQIPDEYAKLSDNLPEKYSAKIKAERLIEKYKNKNSLILANQYLIDIMSCYSKEKYMFIKSIKYFVNNVKINNQLKRKLNKIDDNFYDTLCSKCKKIDNLSEKLELSDDYSSTILF